MKLIFSEYNSDYDNYQFSYCIWALPEKGESIASIFASGYLPSSSNPIRYYLSRSLRISCNDFNLSSENRRILNKNEQISIKLIKKEELPVNEKLISMCLHSATERFGIDVMSRIRLLNLLSSTHTSHFLTYHMQDELVGIVTCFSDGCNVLHYNFSFFQSKTKVSLNNMAIFMMTKAVYFLKQNKFNHIYLGTIYSRKAKYKLQFSGLEFFNGRKWCKELEELKFLIKRDEDSHKHHLLEDPEYVNTFLDGDLNNIEKEKYNET
ncbi:hypothetical protein [Serratia fonticola]|uniref:hypothetical protein n=1 Tax=Serratia fonticola TaxID=47917 RepID=UPI003BB53237